MRTAPIVLVVLCCAHACAAAPPDNIGQRLAARLRAEAPRAWLSYFHELARSQMDIRRTETGVPPSPAQHVTARFVGAYPSCLDEGNSGGGQETATVFNPDRTFRLARVHGGPWYIENIDRLGPPPPLDALQFPQFDKSPPLAAGNRIAAEVALGLKLSPVDFLPVLFARREFEIQDVAPLTEDGLSLVRVRYRFEPARPARNQLARSGEVVLMPDHDWLIKRAVIGEVEPNSSGVIEERITNDYDLASAPIPVLKKQVMVANGAEYKDAAVETDISGFSQATIDPSRFTLSAYGLSEPGSPTPNAARRLLLILTACVVVLLAILTIAKRVRRSWPGRK